MLRREFSCFLILSKQQKCMHLHWNLCLTNATINTFRNFFWGGGGVGSYDKSRICIAYKSLDKWISYSCMRKLKSTIHGWHLKNPKNVIEWPWKKYIYETKISLKLEMNQYVSSYYRKTQKTKYPLFMGKKKQFADRRWILLK